MTALYCGVYCTLRPKFREVRRRFPLEGRQALDFEIVPQAQLLSSKGPDGAGRGRRRGDARRRRRGTGRKGEHTESPPPAGQSL